MGIALGFILFRLLAVLVVLSIVVIVRVIYNVS